MNHLAEQLEKTVSGEVRFDNSSRALHATNASNSEETPTVLKSNPEKSYA